MSFEIPEDLTEFTLSALDAKRAAAENEYSTIMSSVTQDTVTDEQIDELAELRQFWKYDVPAEIQGRKDRADRFSALDGEDEKQAEEVDDEKKDDAPKAVTASTTVTAQLDDTSVKVTVADIIDKNGKSVIEHTTRQGYSTLIAAAGVPDYEAGSKFTDMVDVAKAFIARSAGHGGASGPVGTGPIHYPVAKMVRDYPDEFSVNMDDNDYPKLLALMNEERLPGGSLIASTELRRKEIEANQPGRDALVAAAGWCAPSETDYDICLQITSDGLLDAPEVQARRGGIRHNTGIDFSYIFGSGTGFFNLTEAQVAAGTTKTCLEIPCPDFVDDRLGVTGICLTGNILSIRGYPEFTATFTRGAMAASAHQVNREQIAAVVAGSTAVNLTAAQPWVSDATVVSQVLSAVEMAVVDIKYRLRLQRSATLEVVFPFWLLAQFRADWIRRNGGDYANTLTLADAAITSALSSRGVRAQWVYDWQDAFATGAVSGSPGASTPITSLPTTLSFLIYPAGTWIRAVNDVITLNSVYDSTKLATNQVTHLFTETGWKMIRMCPLSRVYTLNVCPSGDTSSQTAVVCA
jgi:hypothetical protein